MIRKLIRYLFIGLKYLLIQGVVEIVLILGIEYLGVKVLSDFSKANSILENIEGVSWEIVIKTLMFSIIYIPFFIWICVLLDWKKSKVNFRYSIVNTFLNLFLAVIFLVFLRKADISEVRNLLIVTVLASVLIFLIIREKDDKKVQL